MGILSQHSEVPRILEPSEHMLCLHHVFHNLEEESNLLRLEWTLSFQSAESYVLTLKSRQPHKGKEGWGRTVWLTCLARPKGWGNGDAGSLLSKRALSDEKLKM